MTTTPTKRTRKVTKIDYSKLSITELKEKSTFYVTELKKIQELLSDIIGIQSSISKVIGSGPSKPYDEKDPLFIKGYGTEAPPLKIPLQWQPLPEVMTVRTDITMDGLPNSGNSVMFSPIEPIAVIEEKDNTEELEAELKELLL